MAICRMSLAVSGEFLVRSGRYLPITCASMQSRLKLSIYDVGESTLYRRFVVSLKAGRHNVGARHPLFTGSYPVESFGQFAA